MSFDPTQININLPDHRSILDASRFEDLTWEFLEKVHPMIKDRKARGCRIMMWRPFDSPWNISGTLIERAFLLRQYAFYDSSTKPIIRNPSTVTKSNVRKIVQILLEGGFFGFVSTAEIWAPYVCIDKNKSRPDPIPEKENRLVEIGFPLDDNMSFWDQFNNILHPYG